MGKQKKQRKSIYLLLSSLEVFWVEEQRSRRETSYRSRSESRADVRSSLSFLSFLAFEEPEGNPI